MLRDILTVIWKERKGVFRFKGRRSQAIMVLFTPLFFAIYFPWQEGIGWVEGGLSLLTAIVIPLLLVMITIPDSIAGERERHTLETLLASRLSDRAILFGKLATSILFAWFATLVVLFLALITVNVVHWDGQLLFYKPIVLFADTLISLLVAGFCAAVGVFISLRAATVQEAQQTMGAILLIPPMILQFGFIIALESIGKERFREILASIDFTYVVLIVVAVFVALDLLLLFAARRRFQRARLILD
jgi:ABC-2 type transport system permease protein